MKTYEVLIIFADMVKEEKVNDALDTFQSEIERQEGTVLERMALGRRSFARPLKKRDSGQYGKVIFTMAPDRVAALRQRCKFIDVFFRLQITVRAAGYRAPEVDDEPAAEAADTPPAAVEKEA